MPTSRFKSVLRLNSNFKIFKNFPKNSLLFSNNLNSKLIINRYSLVRKFIFIFKFELKERK